jgi:hypothetical protein
MWRIMPPGNPPYVLRKSEIKQQVPRIERSQATQAHYFTRTPGLSPLVNSTPAFSRACWMASTVRGFKAPPVSRRDTVAGATLAMAATSRTPRRSAARAILH